MRLEIITKFHLFSVVPTILVKAIVHRSYHILQKKYFFLILLFWKRNRIKIHMYQVVLTYMLIKWHYKWYFYVFSFRQEKKEEFNMIIWKFLCLEDTTIVYEQNDRYIYKLIKTKKK